MISATAIRMGTNIIITTTITVPIPTPIIPTGRAA
jgi:hypothetical protein